MSLVLNSKGGRNLIKVKILVATHKEASMPDDRKLYLPVLVGAKTNFQEGICFQRDDEGENISAKNANYSELTAVYWAWKNEKDWDAIGLVHYRRFFSLHRKRTLASVLTSKEVQGLLSNYDLILPQKRKYYIESNYSHYVHAHHKEPIDEVRKILGEYYPAYVSSFESVMARRSAHMFNMFIMKRHLFDEYAAWLFDVLRKLEQKIDISSYSTQESRVFGYIAEVLMDVWVEKENPRFIEVGWIQMGSRHLVRKTWQFLLRKIFSNGNKNKSITHF